MNERSLVYLVTIVAFLVCIHPAAHGSEDYYTTDFLYPVQPYAHAVHAFASISRAVNTEGITGSSMEYRWGADYSPFKRFDFFCVQRRLDVDLKRTNNYRFSMNTTNAGFRVALLPAERNWCGISAGACWERSDPGPVFRNGFNMLIDPLAENGDYVFLLSTKEVSRNLWLNAGGKWGRAHISSISPTVGNWAAGFDWQMNDRLQLSGNLKYMYQEYFPSNWNPSLRITWKPCEPAYLQAHVDYYSRGLHSRYPVLEYFIPGDAMTRFGEKPQLYYGAEFSLQF